MNVIAFAVALLIIFIIITISAVNKNKKQWKALNQQGITKEKLIPVETYAGGHPDLDNNLTGTVLYKFENVLIIAEQVSPGEPPENKSFIPIDTIKNIGIQNSELIEKQITLGKAFLIGAFALTWRNKKENGLAFVTIDWYDGKLEHSTIFSFEGKKAVIKANTALKELLKILN